MQILTAPDPMCAHNNTQQHQKPTVSREIGPIIEDHFSSMRLVLYREIRAKDIFWL